MNIIDGVVVVTDEDVAECHIQLAKHLNKLASDVRKDCEKNRFFLYRVEDSGQTFTTYFGMSLDHALQTVTDSFMSMQNKHASKAYRLGWKRRPIFRPYVVRVNNSFVKICVMDSSGAQYKVLELYEFDDPNPRGNYSLIAIGWG